MTRDRVPVHGGRGRHFDLVVNGRYGHTRVSHLHGVSLFISEVLFDFFLYLRIGTG